MFLRNLKRTWVVIQTEWLLSVRSLKFWLATLLTPFILILLYTLFHLIVTEDPREKLLESQEVKSWEYLVDEMFDIRNNLSPSVVRYGVFDAQNQVVRKIRESILRNDQQLFLNYYYTIAGAEYDAFVAVLGVDAVLELKNLLGDLDQTLKGTTRKEQFRKIFSLTSYVGIESDGTKTSFLRTFTEWWEKYSDRIKIAAPALTANLFQEVFPIDDRNSVDGFETLLKTDQIVGYFVLPPAQGVASNVVTFITKKGIRKHEYIDVVNWYRSIANDVMFQLRVDASELTPTAKQALSYSADFSTEDIEVLESNTDVVTTFNANTLGQYVYFILPILMFFIFWAASLRMIGVMVDETSSKLVDKLLASVPQNHLLDGKLWGTAMISLTVVVTWMIFIPVLVTISNAWSFTFSAEFIGYFAQVDVVLNFLLFFILLYALYGYFFLGFLTLFSHVNTAIGVSQIVFLLVSGAVLLPATLVLLIPSSLIQNIFCFVPLAAPLIMVGRSGSLPDWPLYLAIVTVMIASVYGSRALGGLMFRRGISTEMKVASVK